MPSGKKPLERRGIHAVVQPEKTVKPAQPHSLVLGKLVEERINKRQFLSDASATAITPEGQVQVERKKKFKTVGYLPGGVPINKPIHEEETDLALQADFALKAAASHADSHPFEVTDEMTAVRALLAENDDENGTTSQAGFYCSICTVLLKDYSSYLSHLGSKNHLKATGQSLKLEKSSLGQIQAKLALLSQKKSQSIPNVPFEDKWKRLEEQERKQRERLKLEKKQAKKEAKLGNKPELEEDPELEALEAAGFDFTSFGKIN